MKRTTLWAICACLWPVLVSAEPIIVRSTDGVLLMGEFFKPQPGKLTFILHHGLGSVKEEWEPFAKFLSSQGYGALYYDARGHGRSTTRANGGEIHFERFNARGLDSPWGKMIQDLDAIVQFLLANYQIPSKRIAICGASIGANIAYRYANGNKEIPFAILLSPGLDYQGITVSELFERYADSERPLLIAVSTGDRYAYQSAQAFLATGLTRSVNRFKAYVEGPAAGHGVQMFRRNAPDQPSSLEQRIANWVASQKIK